MLNLLLGIVAAALLGGSLTRLSPTVEEVKSRFEVAQKYYAGKDYENGVKIFKEIAETPNHTFLDVDSITVSIDELVLPIRVAATYQVGNSFRNVGLDLLTRSMLAREEGDSLVAVQRRQEAGEALRNAKVHFDRIAGDQAVPQGIRVMSQYQIVRADYSLEDYHAVIEDVTRLFGQFPGNSYEESGFYDLGWAYYQMGDYANSIATFAKVVERSQDAVRVDRALFQMGEGQGALKDYPGAIARYRQLVEKYDFTKVSQQELKGMETAKLRGVVEETTRELVAKAQIKIGDTYALQGEVDPAIEAYALVPQRYPQEEYLVEQAYTRMAELLLDRRGLDAGIRAYQQAIQSVDDVLFKATAQLQTARLLFEAERYAEAIEAYQVYAKAYGEVALQIGFTGDKVLFKIAEAHREIGRKLLGENPEQSQASFTAALAVYDSLLSHFPEPPTLPDIRFGQGVCRQGLGQTGEALALFAEVVRRFPGHPVVPSALLQMARLQYQSGDEGSAVASYERVLAAPAQPGLLDQASIELGVAHKAAGRVDQALAAFQQVSRSSSNWVKVQVEIGDMLTAAGRYTDAQADLDQAIAIAGGDGEALAALHYLKGKIAYSQKRYAEAVPLLGEAVAGQGNEQIAASSRFLRGLSEYELGKARDGAGDSTGGARHYDLATQDLGAILETQIAPKMKNIAYRTLGTANARLGRAAETIRYYEELIARTPEVQERVGFEVLLMELYYDQHHFDQAVDLARRLIGEQFVDDNQMGYYFKERAYSILSSVELEREHYPEAIAVAREGLSQYPQSGESPTQAFVPGLANYFLQRYPDALKGFADYLRLFPRDRRALEGHYYAGMSCQIIGDYQQAASWFRLLADRFPGSGNEAEALFLCAENLYNAVQFKQANDTYQELLRTFPNSDFADDALYSSAWALFDLENTDKGIAQMEQLVARFPGSPHAPRAQYTIGDYYYTIKDYPRAQEAYRTVGQLFPGSPEAGRTEALVGELEEQIASRDYAQAVSKYQQNEHQEAIRLYQLVAEKHPRTYSALAALGNMGVALEYLGDHKKAEETYREVLARAGDNPKYQEVVEFAKARLEQQ